MEQQPYSFQADTWSLGCIIYACLCGSSPFQGFPPTLSEMNTLRIAPRLPTFFSVEVRDLLTHLLDPDPLHRFSIQQALSHPFFNASSTGACSPLCALPRELSPVLSHHSRQRSRSADSLSFCDKFIYEYKETFSPVKDSSQCLSKTGEIRRNLQERLAVWTKGLPLQESLYLLLICLCFDMTSRSPVCGSRLMEALPTNQRKHC